MSDWEDALLVTWRRVYVGALFVFECRYCIRMLYNSLYTPKWVKRPGALIWNVKQRWIPSQEYTKSCQLNLDPCWHARVPFLQANHIITVALLTFWFIEFEYCRVQKGKSHQMTPWVILHVLWILIIMCISTCKRKIVCRRVNQNRASSE